MRVFSAFILALAFCSAAKAETLIARYDVNLGGLHLGDAMVHATVGAQNYKVTIAANVGVIFADRRIEGEASGTRKGAKLTPEHFQMTTSGGDTNAVDIGFTGATAVSANISPPISAELLRDRVPLTKEHLKGVLDPLSALLVTVLASTKSSSPCNGVLPIYTGYARFDLNLRPAARTEELNAAIVPCQARYVAIAGHSRSEEEETKNIELTIYFRKISDPHLWLIERISIPTPIGTVTVDRAEGRVG